MTKLRMMSMTILFVAIPILVSGYITKLIAEDHLLNEKEKKLFGVTSLLDQYLEKDFDAILLENGAMKEDRTTRIEILNKELGPFTDSLANAYPGIGVGYYDKELQAIVTYGPSTDFGNRVGEDIDDTHPGREVMEIGQKHIGMGMQVRGQILNAMQPLIRNGVVIGYVWANELTTDVQDQLWKMDWIIFICLAVGMLLIIVLLLRFWSRILDDVELVTDGLNKMKFDLHARIKGVSGEIGIIADEINGMAIALLNARTLSENVMDSMVDGVITIDVNRNITYMNKAATELLGVRLSEVMGRPYIESIFHDVAFTSVLLDTLETGQNFIGVEMEYPANGRYLYISSSTSRLHNSYGDQIGAVVTFKDISEKKRLEQQVYHADRLAALGEMMAGIAHEIRNPLTAIKSLVQYLHEGSTEEERQEFHPMIVKEVDRVNKIIEEILYFARPSKSAIVKVDVNQLIQETILLAKNMTKNKVKNYHLKFLENLPMVEMDPEQFKQVFLNILINSAQAIKNSGEITVESLFNSEREKVTLHFSDTGPGIVEENLKRVFDPFYTSKKEGTGLGLAVVQRIVESHHGVVWVENISSEGLRVSIEIPIYQVKEDITK